MSSSEWTLWFYDHKMEEEWDNEKIQKISDVDSLEMFESIMQMLNQEAFPLGMFFMMRKGVPPKWEDDQNIKGGCWSYKISFVHVYSLWKELGIHLLQDSLCPENPLLIHGMSISPKKGFSTLKIWNNDSCYRDPTILNTSIKQLHHDLSIYQPFLRKDIVNN